MSEKVVNESEQGKKTSDIHQTNGNGRRATGEMSLEDGTGATAESGHTTVEPVEPELETLPARNGKRRRIFMLAGAGVLVLAIVGTLYWIYARQFESTDDAFVEADITQVAPKVAAYVKKIHVSNNQFVHKGDVLIELDPAELQVHLQQARAQLEQAKSQRQVAAATVDLTEKTSSAGQQTAQSNVESARQNVEQQRLASQARQSQISQASAALKTARASLGQTQAQVPSARSTVQLAQVEYDRRQNLFSRGDISHENLDQAQNRLQTAKAQLNEAEQSVIAAQSRVNEAEANVRTAQETFRQSVAQVGLTQSQVGESQGRLQDASAAPERVEVSQTQVGAAEATIQAAEAEVAQAELELSYAQITAPEDGFVTRKTVEEGQLVQVGTPLMAISQSDDVWVIANFKETQLEFMQPGQKVAIEVDAFPSEDFEGHVESLQAGTGSRFSVLPAENATGNFVKVVQRVPVKIVFDEPADKVKRLVPGMSVEPSVKVR
ncbi:MAG: secretion protein HlyD [Acidobacteria bacterium]|nr:MAG: secretion protein HlyD [Acidobacteriota bacterium]